MISLRPFSSIGTGKVSHPGAFEPGLGFLINYRIIALGFFLSSAAPGCPVSACFFAGIFTQGALLAAL